MADFWFWGCYLSVKTKGYRHTESPALWELSGGFSGEDSWTRRCQAKVICTVCVRMVQSLLNYMITHCLFQSTRPFFIKEDLTCDCETGIHSDRDPCSSPALCICCTSWKVCGTKGGNARDSRRHENIYLLLRGSLLLGGTEFGMTRLRDTKWISITKLCPSSYKWFALFFFLPPPSDCLRIPPKLRFVQLTSAHGWYWNQWELDLNISPLGRTGRADKISVRIARVL